MSIIYIYIPEFSQFYSMYIFFIFSIHFHYCHFLCLQGSSPSVVQAFIREGLRLKDLDHPNIIRLLGVHLNSQPHYIVLEFMSFGDLKAVLRLCNNNSNNHRSFALTLSHLMHFTRDVALGFHYLQQKSNFCSFFIQVSS